MLSNRLAPAADPGRQLRLIPTIRFWPHLLGRKMLWLGWKPGRKRPHQRSPKVCALG